MNNPLTVPSDMGQDFDRDKFVQWEQRQPAEVSWWVTAKQSGFTALANSESTHEDEPVLTAYHQDERVTGYTFVHKCPGDGCAICQWICRHGGQEISEVDSESTVKC